MNCLFWNIRGVANRASILALKKLILNNSSELVFISEPWMKWEDFPQHWFDRFDLKLFAVNSRDNLLPNLWCFCKSNYNPDIILIDDQHISFTLKMYDTNSVFGFSIVYASTNYRHRRNLWLALGNRSPNIPWTYLGDFNAILNASEYRGSHVSAKVPMQDFHNWTDSNNLIHIPTLGNAFTWCNGRKGRHRTKKMLDRAICNMALIDSCYSIVSNTLTKANSDHYPILITIKRDNLIFKSQFKFHKMWTLNSDCDRLVRETWNEKFYGCPMYILDQNLKLLKSRLKSWNKYTFGNVHIITTQAESNIKNIQLEIEDHGYSDILLEKEIKAQHDLNLALNIEEELWKEKSKLNWHLHGDRNTKFYHTYATIKRKNNLISCLNINGKLEYDQKMLEDHIENHFFKLFNSKMVWQDSNLIQRVVPNLVNEETNDMLTRIPSSDEIYNAVTNLNINSAPGPDGFGAFFFVHYWKVIKIDVINAISQFFLQG
ncbi:uncharacterized protein LOC131619539 [Vicia villosa]|uniref:uncharacterized protein LOC131619539 n=1 Tax=Vicia villosa TaxID=3911 RepID=UPI00273AFFBA|nr:uncharacterized protein LOC131619539 [Vicia villosa]